MRTFAFSRDALSVAVVLLAGCGGLQPSASQRAFTPQSSAPQWQQKHLATAACPQVIGKPTCTVLIQSRHAAPSGSGWTPADLQARYRLPSGTNGSGQVVAIVDAYDNPNVASDLAAYRSNFGLGSGSFTKYNQLGQTYNYPTGNTGWGLEIDLDVEMVSAVCPNCTIALIEANSSYSSDLQAAEAEAVTLGAHIVSNSWICYGNLQCIDPSYFNAPGVVYLAASGDSGYNAVGPPSAFGSVVAVGGTVLSESGKGFSEAVWDGAGAGCVSGEAKPSWQHDPDCSGRTDADVSAVAWNVEMYDTYGNSGWMTVGGTSVATPLNAAVFALAGNAGSQNAAKKFWKAKTKKRSKYLYYISSGNDGSCGGTYLCQAGTNQFKTYGGPIGWGTPNGIGLY